MFRIVRVFTAKGQLRPQATAEGDAPILSKEGGMVGLSMRTFNGEVITVLMDKGEIDRLHAYAHKQ